MILMNFLSSISRVVKRVVAGSLIKRERAYFWLGDMIGAVATVYISFISYRKLASVMFLIKAKSSQTS